MKKDLLKIINNYGLNEQLKYMQSEIYELNEAVIRHQEHLRNPIDVVLNALEPAFAFVGNREPDDNLKSIKDELADVMVMLKQIQYYFNISDSDIVDIMKYKIDRQLKRINDESEVKVNENVQK